MQRKSSTPTTVALVAILLVPVYLIAQKVTPAPPGPPAPPQKEVPKPAETVKMPSKEQMMADSRKKMQAHYETSTKKGAKASSKPAFNPTSIEVSDDFWKQNTDGDAGITTMRKRVDEALEEQKKEHEAKGNSVDKAAKPQPMVKAPEKM